MITLSQYSVFPKFKHFPFLYAQVFRLMTASPIRKDKPEGSQYACAVLQQDLSSQVLASPSPGDAGSVNPKFSSTLVPARPLFTRPRIALVK